jgi:phosphinothricin acetyltransferase
MALIRLAAPRDLEAIAAIYAHHVRHGTSSFELEPPDEAEIDRRRREVLARGLPYLAAEVEGRVAGFAYAGLYRPRRAYRYTVEDSIYLHPDFVRRGIGRALLGRVIEECAGLGYRQMIAVIGDSANAASIGLHESLGFRTVGVLQAVGYKFDRWVDSVLMQRAL